MRASRVQRRALLLSALPPPRLRLATLKGSISERVDIVEQAIQWFAPYTVFPGPAGAYPDTNEQSTNFCKIATDLGTAGGIAADAQGRIYIAESSGLRIDRFSPPFPTGPDAAGGCGRADATGAPLAIFGLAKIAPFLGLPIPWRRDVILTLIVAVLITLPWLGLWADWFEYLLRQPTSITISLPLGPWWLRLPVALALLIPRRSYTSALAVVVPSTSRP